VIWRPFSRSFSIAGGNKTTLKIAIGSDLRGYEVKRRIGSLVQRLGHEVVDMGPSSSDSVDYPDYAFQVAKAVRERSVDRGILICGTSIGMCIAANKVPGVRAAPCHDSITAEMSRRHNDANVLCLSADLLGGELVDRMVQIWLETGFEGGRHARRVEKITRFEEEMVRGQPSKN
jgi:ribose 5-phosphate isomerase B